MNQDEIVKLWKEIDASVKEIMEREIKNQVEKCEHGVWKCRDCQPASEPVTASDVIQVCDQCERPHSKNEGHAPERGNWWCRREQGKCEHPDCSPDAVDKKIDEIANRYDRIDCDPIRVKLRELVALARKNIDVTHETWRDFRLVNIPLPQVIKAIQWAEARGWKPDASK